ncbi:DUF6802 family protein [Nocardia niwae]|uniref:DUF6802 family protein n=1 Tax=Nocardia niwae TaxID=626084 RepID=A0ABV2X9D9_9NOCA|nr:DUF6802 family protein [Nocardia niwae]
MAVSVVVQVAQVGFEFGDQWYKVLNGDEDLDILGRCWPSSSKAWCAKAGAMVTSGDLPGLDLPHVDAHAELGGLGAVELHHPTQDIDQDGLLDSATITGDDAVQVWTDIDHDGFADHVKVVEKDGDYTAWEFHRHPDGTSEWIRTDQGRLGTRAVPPSR